MQMALTSSVISSPSCRILLSKSLPYGLHRPNRTHVCTYPAPASFCIKSPRMSLSGELHNLKANANHVMQKLYESVPDSVRKFPWKEAETAVIQRFLVNGQEALKWSLSALFILSCVADTIYSISTNKELLIPFGLFVGCMTTDFLRETSKELFQYSKERGLDLHLLGIGCFIVIVKLIAMYVLDRPVFLLHLANGAIIQLLWHWRNSSESQAGSESETSI